MRRTLFASGLISLRAPLAITFSGPSTYTSGLSCSLSAFLIAPGPDSRLTGRTESPERAPQAPAGIAHSARSPETITTLPEGFPLAAEKKRSIAAARSYASSPSTTALRKPDGRPVPRPMRMTWASLERSDPLGFSRSIVSWVTGGTSPPSVRRIGAPIGAPARTLALTAPCQSPLSTSTTAVGRGAPPVEGKTALATPAASAAGSPPPTLIVFLVAVEGKPSLALASLSLDLAPSWGGRLESLPRLQPASVSDAAATSKAPARAPDQTSFPRGTSRTIASARGRRERLERRLRG